MAILLFVSCKKEINTSANAEKDKTTDEVTTITNKKPSQVSVCHKTSSPVNPWLSIEINIGALPAHLAHGDVVPDAAKMPTGGLLLNSMRIMPGRGLWYITILF